MRKTPFVTGEFYHVYNRGVDKRIIFPREYDFARFLQSMDEFNSVQPIGSLFQNSFRESKLRRPTSKLVNIVCYCLNPNHYHLLLEQKVDGGISEFIKRLAGGYTKYLNARYKRSGVLFQGKFKSVYVASNEYLLHLSAYINLNNKVHKLKRQSFASSWDEYINENKNQVCGKGIILRQFKNRQEYKNFAEGSSPEIIRRKETFKEVEDLLLD